MLPTEYHILRANEDSHWWYRVLHQQVASVLRQHLSSFASLLDAGCGTGGMLAYLKQHFPSFNPIGIDDSPIALNHCLARGLAPIQKASLHDLPFPSASFDAVLCLDVLYHQNVNPNSAMREITRVLKPNGLLILNLPAFTCLAGSHDHSVAGARRFNLSVTRSLLDQNNLHTLQSHYWNAWLFFPLLIWRTFTRLSLQSDSPARSDLRSLPPKLNRCLAQLASLDAALCRRWHLPFGSSLFVVASKPTLAQEP